MIDCLQVPSQMKFDTLPPDYTALQISFIKSTRLGTTIELQDLTIVCGSNDAEQCCELPGKKVLYNMNFSFYRCKMFLLMASN